MPDDLIHQDEESRQTDCRGGSDDRHTAKRHCLPEFVCPTEFKNGPEPITRAQAGKHNRKDNTKDDEHRP